MRNIKFIKNVIPIMTKKIARSEGGPILNNVRWYTRVQGCGSRLVK